MPVSQLTLQAMFKKKKKKWGEFAKSKSTEEECTNITYILGRPVFSSDHL